MKCKGDLLSTAATLLSRGNLSTLLRSAQAVLGPDLSKESLDKTELRPCGVPEKASCAVVSAAFALGEAVGEAERLAAVHITFCGGREMGRLSRRLTMEARGN